MFVRLTRAPGLLLLSLDSNVYTEAESQKTWMEQVMNTSSQRWRTAIYHAPMWPSVRAVTDSISSSLRANWGALFERLGVDVAFENHDHAYKRTKPMVASGPAANGVGTLHVGDGKWGLDEGLRKPTLRDYNAFVSESAFVLLVQVNNTALFGRAIDMNNGTVDTFSCTGFDP